MQPKIKPLKHYGRPAYPTRAVLDEHPELLRLVPKRWRGNPLVLGVLTWVCVLLSGCRTGSDAKGKQTVVSRVAPLFIHGEGRGAYGCVVVNPPVFLSEDEARQVIVEEGRRAEISFAADVQTIPHVYGPVTEPYALGEKRKMQREVRPLQLDGTDAQRKIAYEYVSRSDFRAWQDYGGRFYIYRDGRFFVRLFEVSSVSSYDTQKAADVLRDGLVRAKPKGTYAVFYDPMVSWNGANAQESPHENLRGQVRDFIEWLKAEGVI
jgi:hypothetical protein